MPYEKCTGVKPCPFCCEDDLVIRCDDQSYSSRVWNIWCQICNAWGPEGSDPDDAKRLWNERKYQEKNHAELDRIAKRLTKMNQPEHDDVFPELLNYEETVPYWDVASITINILDNYDKNISKIYTKVANLFAKVRSLLKDFDDDLES